jgi:predicted MPP superfamily phosphohydrolase
VGLSDWDDRLTRALVRPPYRDEAGRKGWLERFTRAQGHHVRRLNLALARWPRWSRPLRIAFLADFHTGSHAGDVARLEAIVAEASGQAPDLVLLGGDFVNMMPFGGGRVPPHTIARVLGRIDAPLGRIAVIGNHDRNYGPEEIVNALRQERILVLEDAAATVSFEGSTIRVVGIPDARVERPDVGPLLASLPSDQPTLVLAHDPYWFAHLPPGPHLMLAGHTHGGQICLPWIGPIRNASHAPMRWSYGLVEEGGKRMYVTSGLGCSGIPLRLNRPPEFAIIEIAGA